MWPGPPKECVTFRHSLSIKDWKIRCITKFDFQERRLTDIFNNDKLIAVAQRRIAQWGMSGSSLNLTYQIEKLTT